MNREIDIPESIPVNHCPFCGGKDFTFRYSTNLGQGDHTFSDGRVFCKTCTASKGDEGYYGSPEYKHIRSAVMKWNNRAIHIPPTPEVPFTKAFQPGYNIIPLASPTMKKGQAALFMHKEDHEHLVKAVEKLEKKKPKKDGKKQ